MVGTPETEEKAAVKKSVKAPAKAEKKAPVKKAASKKAELKTEMFLQFAGKEYTDKEIFDKIKYVWSKVLKNKVGDMKDVKIYLKRFSADISCRRKPERKRCGTFMASGIVCDTFERAYGRAC